MKEKKWITTKEFFTFIKDNLCKKVSVCGYQGRPNGMIDRDSIFYHDYYYDGETIIEMRGEYEPFKGSITKLITAYSDRGKNIKFFWSVLEVVKLNDLGKERVEYIYNREKEKWNQYGRK